MKIFIINLEHQTKKRQFMQDQLDQLKLEAEFIPAVNGKAMSLDELREVAVDYDNSFLTAGEVGCALSHISVYKKMVDDNIQQALILEDDAILADDLLALLNQIQENTPSKATTYLLTDIEVRNQKVVSQLSEKYSTHRILRSICAHGYIINLEAAKNLAKLLSLVRFEADRWDFFYRLGVIDLYCVTPALIGSKDTDKTDSVIEADRMPLVQARISAYETLMHKEMPIHLKVKWALWRLLVRPFIKKIKT